MRECSCGKYDDLPTLKPGCDCTWEDAFGNKHTATPAYLQAVIDAAKAWAVERFPKDAYERHLMAMVAKAFPDEWHFSDDCVHCSEEDREGCPECPSRAELQAAVARSEAEMKAIKEAERKYAEELTSAKLHDQKQDDR